MLKPENCSIGMEFWSDGGHWRCTDIGKRTVIAIKLDQEDPRSYAGPPYMVVEDAMDGYDLQTCYATKEECDNNFPDIDDGPDPSHVVRYESGVYHRRGMEQKMVVEFNEAEFSAFEAAWANHAGRQLRRVREPLARTPYFEILLPRCPALSRGLKPYPKRIAIQIYGYLARSPT